MKKPRKQAGQFKQSNPDPTPQEIAERAAEIRAEWGEAAWKRARRRYGASMPTHQGSYRISREAGEVE